MPVMSDNDLAKWNLNCPILVTTDSQRISLAHGEGARLTRRLISETILPRLCPGSAPEFADAAQVTATGCRLAVCSDSHTVSPIFFPGGDLGSLSVYGTVNDLAVSGSLPRWLTMSLIIEEGLPIVVLEQILDSAARAAQRCEISIVAGDTKVVPRGAVDGLFLNTTGIGEMLDPIPSGPQSMQVGDKILVSGPIGQHGIAVMSARDGFHFEPPPLSDSGPVLAQVAALRAAAGQHVRSIRDATRGGVSSVLHEWALECRCTFALVAAEIPVTDIVRGACELLGLDPLYVANEGTIVAAVAADYANVALGELQRVPGCEQAAIIGEVQPADICSVTIRRTFGSPQPLDEPSGAPLPRIC